MVTHLKPDILECEVKGALRNITMNKTSRSVRIPSELFKILNNDTLNKSANLENSAVATGLEKSVFIPVPKKGNAKECSNYRTIALISLAGKITLKILQTRFQ